MTKFQGIKACAFDAYGTLFDVHSPVGRVAQGLDDKAQAVSQTWRDRQLQYTWLRSMMGMYADFWRVTGDALDFSLALHGVDDTAVREQLMKAYMTLDAYPDVAPTLAKLKAAGLQTAILSNGTPEMLKSAVASASIENLIDLALSADEAGIYKPDSRVYQLAVDRLGVAAGEICFVSTNGWDAAGAAHFGFRVAWLNRFGLIPERLPDQPDAIIERLDELPGLISAE